MKRALMLKKVRFEAGSKKSKVPADGELNLNNVPDDIMELVMGCCDRITLRALHVATPRLRSFSLKELTKIFRRSAELRLVHSMHRQSFLLLRKEKNDLSFVYSLDLCTVNGLGEFLESPEKKLTLKEERYKTRGNLKKELKALVSEEPVAIDRNHTPFTAQFIKGLNEVLKMNSYQHLRCVNMLIDPSFFTGLAHTLKGITEVELSFISVNTFSFDKEDYQKLSDWIVSIEPTKLTMKDSLDICRNIVKLPFFLSLASSFVTTELIVEDDKIESRRLFDLPYANLDDLLHFTVLRLPYLRLDKDHLFQLLDMQLHKPDSVKAHWQFYVTGLIELKGVNEVGLSSEDYNFTEIVEDLDEGFIAHSTRKDTRAEFTIKEKDGLFLLDVQFTDS